MNIQSISNTTFAILLLLLPTHNMSRLWSSHKQPTAKPPAALQPRSHSHTAHAMEAGQQKDNSKMEGIEFLPTPTKTWGCVSALSERSDDGSGSVEDGEWQWIEDGKLQWFDWPSVEDGDAQKKLLEAVNSKSPSSRTGPMHSPPTRSPTLQETPRTISQTAMMPRSRLPKASSNTVHSCLTSPSLQQKPLTASQETIQKCTLASCVYVRTPHPHGFHQTAGYLEW